MAAARMAPQPVLCNELLFLTLFPPVFFAAWLGGLRAALLATASDRLIEEYARS